MYPLIPWKVVFGDCWLSPVSQKEGAAPKNSVGLIWLLHLLKCVGCSGMEQHLLWSQAF